MITLIIVIIYSGCKRPVASLFENEIDSIALRLAPDRREAVFNVELFSTGKELILKGETDIPLARDAVVEFLNSKGVNYLDSLSLLPDITEVEEPWGLVNVSVCNIRAAAYHSSELVSQALLGTPVRILKKKGGWFMIQSPDKYIGWVDSEAIALMDQSGHNNWKKSSKIIFLQNSGLVFGDNDRERIISDIVAGSVLETTREAKTLFEVKFPDGRMGFVEKRHAGSFHEWLESADPAPENLMKSAVAFMGIPYLWGGASSKGFDCSGFVKTIFFLNGVIIARDADLQFSQGERIDCTGYPDSLSAGDLLFFGSVGASGPRPTHVGMYLEDSEFIHASGMVKINSLDSTRGNFSRGRRESFLGVRRITGSEPGNGLRLISQHPWYN